MVKMKTVWMRRQATATKKPGVETPGDPYTLKSLDGLGSIYLTGSKNS
jgi:hypothetical protein